MAAIRRELVTQNGKWCFTARYTYEAENEELYELYEMKLSDTPYFMRMYYPHSLLKKIVTRRKDWDECIDILQQPLIMAYLSSQAGRSLEKMNVELWMKEAWLSETNNTMLAYMIWFIANGQGPALEEKNMGTEAVIKFDWINKCYECYPYLR